MKKILLVFLTLLLVSTGILAQPRNPEARPPDDSVFRKYESTAANPAVESKIASVLKEMALSSCRKQHTLRILFYGQSITEQGWWKRLVEYWQSEYPGVNFEIENRAIGGHATDLLLKTAEADIYRFNPDLLIFHAYGSHKAYEALIQNVRERTSAEVIIATDHVVNDAERTEESSYWKLAFWHATRWFGWYWGGKPQYHWGAWMNHVFLPDLAQKYGLELVDVRLEWKKYLRDNGLKASQMLIDSVHLNANGEYLMAEIMKTHFAKNRIRGSDCSNTQVREFFPDKAALASSKDYQFKVTGNRLELSVDPARASDFSITVDGVPPSRHYEAFAFGRSTVFPGTTWPALLQVHHGLAPSPQEETWSACVDPAVDGASWNTFELRGSKTGFDGKGQTNARFVSNSAQIVIEAEDWNLNYAQQVWSQHLDKRTCFSWDALSPGVDRITSRGASSAPVLAFAGLGNTEHLVELKGANLAALQSFRVFHPPMKCLRAMGMAYCYFH